MTPATRYAVLGAGKQGTAAAYDLARWNEAGPVLLLDANRQVAEQAVERLNHLLEREAAVAIEVDASSPAALTEALTPIDVFVCAAPFRLIPGCTQAAIAARASMVDLGGHTETVLAQWARSAEAQAAGISIVPDCGMGPGLNNTMGLYTVEQLQARGATPREVRLWDGGLPQNPPAPWGYQCTFHINGLTNEYDGQALTLRGGLPTPVDALTEPERVTFEGLGEFEAFVTSGGTSTVPYSLEGVLQVYENKTLRYPGHYQQFKAFKDLGLFREEAITLPSGVTVTPRELYHTLLAPQLNAERVVDICLMRATGVGGKEGREVTFTVELVDRYDPVTGFTAMERLTGWHAAIMAQFIGRGEVPPGVWPLEKAIPASRFMDEVRKRGFEISERWEEAGD